MGVAIVEQAGRRPAGAGADWQEDDGIKKTMEANFNPHPCPAAAKTPNFEVGFRFVPSPVVIVENYLRPRVLEGIMAPDYLIRECDVYRHDPWDLFQLHRPFFQYTDDNMYFFSPRHHSSSARRACRIAGGGFWAGQGRDELIKKGGRVVGHKTQLTFKKVDQGKKKKTDWLMHEFRLGDGGKFDELVLCKIYEKKSAACRQQDDDHHATMLAPQNTPTMLVLEDDDDGHHQKETMRLPDDDDHPQKDQMMPLPDDHDHQKDQMMAPAMLLPESSTISSPSRSAAELLHDEEYFCDIDVSAPLLTPEELDSLFEAATSPWVDQLQRNYYTALTACDDYFAADVPSY